MNDVSIDVETPLPKEHHVTLVAAIPPGMDDTELKKFKRKVQLTALRYGINHIETVPREASTNDDERTESMWLRLPFMSIEPAMSSHLSKYGKIAVALAESSDPTTGRRPRIDLYELPKRDGDPFGGYVAHPFGDNGPFANLSMEAASASAVQSKRTADPFGESAPIAADPFAASEKTGASEWTGAEPFGGSARAIVDPFGASAPTPGDPFGDSASTPVGAQLKQQIVRHRQLLAKLRKDSDAAIKSGESAELVRKVVVEYVKDEYALRIELQRLELAMLKSKVAKLEQTIRARDTKDIKRSIIDERVRKLMGQVAK